MATIEQKQGTEACVRWMLKRDLPEILAIAKEDAENSMTEKSLLAFRQQRESVGMVIIYVTDQQRANQKRCQMLVKELDALEKSEESRKENAQLITNVRAELTRLDTETVAGFVLYLYLHDEIRIVNFRVAKAWQGKGADDVLLDEMKSKINGVRRKTLLAEAPEADVPFFEQRGFQKTPNLVAYYRAGARIMKFVA